MELINSQDRHLKFLSLLEKNGYNVRKSAIEAGFSPITALKSGKKIYKTALKKQAERQLMMLRGDVGSMELKHEMKEGIAKMIGMTNEEIMNIFKGILLQEKDYGTKLKALRPFLKEQGISIEDDEDKRVKVPNLNITLSESVVSTPIEAEYTIPNGLTEPQEETPEE